MEYYQLKKPEVTEDPGEIVKLIDRVPNILTHIEKVSHPEYLFWDKAKYKCPENLRAEEFWALVKFWRRNVPLRTTTVVNSEHGKPFTWQQLPDFGRICHEVDMNLGGAVMQLAQLEDEATRRRYLIRGIMEEAIASSQLEGAHTTRAAAKEMLVQKRQARNESEQMILNNYSAMRTIEEEYITTDLSQSLLFELHETLTRNTKSESGVGRFRNDGDKVAVHDPTTGKVLHYAPNEEFLSKEMPRLIKYANDDLAEMWFVHPVIKAIMLHFWIGYLHPFTDGNGRTARALFYWYLLKKGYRGFAYIPLSKVIKNSPAQYRDAYVYSEQDDNDLTYFIDYNVRKIIQARREFETYVERKQAENSKMASLARAKYNLNNRQIQLLKHLHKNPDATSTIRTHAEINDISRMTARKDLEGLEALGLLSSEKVGRERPFRATPKTTELLS